MGFFQARVLQWGAIALSSQCPLDPSNSDKGGQALLLPSSPRGPQAAHPKGAILLEV